MELIAIEEHWNHPALTAAVKALPPGRGDPSLAFNEMSDNLERLDDLGDVEVTTSDRLLFSTDYPFQQPTRDDISAFLGELPSGADRDLFTGNARALFGLEGGSGFRAP